MTLCLEGRCSIQLSYGLRFDFIKDADNQIRKLEVMVEMRGESSVCERLIFRLMELEVPGYRESQQYTGNGNLRCHARNRSEVFKSLVIKRGPSVYGRN